MDGLYKEFVRNISGGGVFIETSVPFQPGKAITLTFSLPDREGALEITGKIVRKVPEGIGIRFTTVSARDLQKLIESL